MDRTGQEVGRRILGLWTRLAASVKSDQDIMLPGSGSTRPCWRPVEHPSFGELLWNNFGG